MSKKRIRIKNMVCPRCIKVVHDEITKLGYDVYVKRLGLMEIEDSNIVIDMDVIRDTLERYGFELLIEKQYKIIEEIKTLIIELIYQDRLEEMSVNLSNHLVENLNHDYSSLSTLFSSVENITIEKYFIHKKVDRIKELIIYDELTLSEISYRLAYSSVQYLSNQFKNTTGMSPSQFKSKIKTERSTVENIG